MGVLGVLKRIVGGLFLVYGALGFARAVLAGAAAVGTGNPAYAGAAVGFGLVSYLFVYVGWRWVRGKPVLKRGPEPQQQH